MDYYFAVFSEVEHQVLVFFPDLGIPQIKGKTWDEAFETAVAALAEWLAEKNIEYINTPSTYEEIRQKNHSLGGIVPIPVDKEIVKHRQKTKRVSVVFPVTVLQKVDKYCAKKGLRRSTLMVDAVLDYIKNNK